jgi:ATP-dependent DNA helicase RecG
MIDTAGKGREVTRVEVRLQQHFHVLERLVELGPIEARGLTNDRVYTLSAKVHLARGQSTGYVRQAGFDPIQQEQMVTQYLRDHGRITR